MTPEEYEKKIKELEAQNAELKTRLNRAKDPEPKKRPGFGHVKQLAQNCCLGLARQLRKGKTIGFIVRLGHKTRIFKRLKDVWEFLTQENWDLEELFPKFNPNQPKPKKPKTCKYCERPVRWQKEWLTAEHCFDFWLANPDGSPHKCQEYKRHWAKILSDPLPEPEVII